MVSYYNSVTKERGWVYNISEFLSVNIGDNYYEYDCNLNIKVKDDSLEYDLYIMNFDYEKREYIKTKFNYPTPEFKSTNEIFNFFNHLINSRDCKFFQKIKQHICSLYD